MVAIRKSPAFRRDASIAGIVACLIFAASSAAAQDSKFRMGTLTCIGEGSIGLLIGSKERLSCTFAPSGGGPKREFYGSITKFGLDVGIKGKSVMVWGVFGSSAATKADALGGRFVGASADASLGVGGGGNILVGGNAKSISLQPLSVKAQVGVNLAIGVAGMRLEPR